MGGPVAAGTNAWVVLVVWAVVSQVLAAKSLGWSRPLGGDVGEKGVDLRHAGLHASGYGRGDRVPDSGASRRPASRRRSLRNGVGL